MLIIGNWKMHGDRARLAELVDIDRVAARISGVDVAICPPSTLIGPACEQVNAMAIGAQDCHARDDGAFTGGVSAAMLVEVGAQLVLVGHSECREAGAAGDALVRAKANAAVAAGLAPIVCVGEPAGGEAVSAVAAQLVASLPIRPMAGFAVAYEPIWAIGTGSVPAPDAIAATLAALRQVVCAHYGDAEGKRVPLLYGGSVDGSNAGALLAITGLGGLLVGGASLTAATFVPILRAAERRD